MFAPSGQPWYTGAFWSNQTQWAAVTLPVYGYTFWRFVKGQRERHEDLKSHITSEHEKSRKHLEKSIGKIKR